ncbi:MAG TPA: YhbY family RNA-binding protein [Candidatus Thermoplasmatota archaeon]|nr:YhbY family RNA-binding protein [Candidatus Thermoplasmatota archaeon]
MIQLTPDQVRAKRAEAQQLAVSFHVGKNGVNEAAVAELLTQLKKHKLVKARLLPSATAGGADDRGQAQALADAVGAQLIEVRGHTAVYWRG